MRRVLRDREVLGVSCWVPVPRPESTASTNCDSPPPCATTSNNGRTAKDELKLFKTTVHAEVLGGSALPSVLTALLSAPSCTTAKRCQKGLSAEPACMTGDSCAVRKPQDDCATRQQTHPPLMVVQQ